MISKKQIWEELNSRGINPMEQVIEDAVYVALDHQWFLETWIPSFRRNIVALGLDKWEEEVNDCDDFDSMGKFFMSRALARTEGHPKAAAAFGVFRYTPDGQTKRHRINFGFTDKWLFFFEPQPPICNIVDLSPEELASCSFYYI